MGETFTTRQAAKQLKESEWRINDLLRREKLTEPARFGGRRVWTQADIDLAKPIVKQNAVKKKRAK